MADNQLDPIGQQMLALVTRGDTRVTRVVPSGATAQVVVKADPRRLFFQVWGLLGASTVGVLLPSPDVLGQWTSTSMPSPFTMKFHDSPTLTTGAWYGKGNDASGWIVIEELYQGDA